MGLKFDYPDGATPIDPNEAEGLIPLISTQAELNAFELLNITDAVSWASRSKRVRQSILTEPMLRRLHKRMFGRTWRWAGKYRQTQKSIGFEAYRIPSEVRGLVDDVTVWLEHDSYPPDEIAARFHHRLVYIHPFPNGNGRFARLATDILCLREDWEEPTWGSVNLGNAGTARTQYISALREADAHNILPLIRFIRS